MRRMRILIWLLVVVTGLQLTGCAYMNTRAPYDSDLERTDLGSKVGTADAHGLLWLVAWGDAGYAAAARNGGITVMKHADQQILVILFGLYTRWRIIVYGD